VQIKTREDAIVLLPYDLEHKIMHHAWCNHYNQFDWATSRKTQGYGKVLTHCPQYLKYEAKNKIFLALYLNTNM